MSTPSQQPLSAAALRGAVDLSALRQRPGAAAGAGGAAPTPGSASGAPGAGSAPAGLHVELSDATFSAALADTANVPAILAIWAARVPGSQDYVSTLTALAQRLEGRLRVLSLDLDANPGAAQALTPVLQQAFGQISALPVVLALVQSQPMPLFQGPVPEDQLLAVLEQVLQAAASAGVTGRVDLGPADDEATDADTEDGAEEPELSSAQTRAFEAIERGDWAEATAVYQEALAVDPRDEEARLGLAQVRLMERTDGQDLATVRAAADQAGDDLTAQTLAADVEVLSGVPEEAFARLVDLVRRTSGAERNTVREHLVGLFDVVGAQDPRVATARRNLMSALF